MVKLDVPKNDLVPLILRPGLFLVCSWRFSVSTFASLNRDVRVPTVEIGRF